MTDYRWNFGFLIDYWPVLWSGMIGMLVLAGSASIIGSVLGVLIGIGRISKSRIIRAACVCYVEIFRNTPALVQLLWLYYALPILTGAQLNPLTAALIAFSLYTGAFMAEIYRGGIESLERGQWEAGKAIGLSYTQQMRHIILPQAVRRMVPALTNQFIETVKLTSIASLIAYQELVYYTKYIADLEFRPIEAFTVLAVMFSLILIPISYLSLYFEKRLNSGK